MPSNRWQLGSYMDCHVPILAIFTFGCGFIIWFVMLYWAYKAYQGVMFDIPVVTNFIKEPGLGVSPCELRNPFSLVKAVARTGFFLFKAA